MNHVAFIFRLVFISYTFIFIEACFSQDDFHSQEIQLIKKGNLAKLRDAKTCIGKFYFAVKNDFEERVSCLDKDAISAYYTHQILFDHLVFNRNYVAAISQLRDIIELAKNHKELINVDIDSVKEQILMLSSIAEHQNKQKEQLQLSNDWQVSIENFDYKFSIDTGTFFGSAPNKEFKSSNKVIDFTGQIDRVEYGFLENSGNNSLLLFNNNEYYLGVQFLKNYKNIVFSKNDSSSVGVKFYNDNSNIFFISTVRYKEYSFEGQNICIDTGSEKSYASISEMKNLVRKDSTLRANLAFESIQTATGIRALKTVDLDDIELLGKSGISIRLVLNGYHNPICNVVLGRDLLKGWLLTLSWEEHNMRFAKPIKL